MMTLEQRTPASPAPVSTTPASPTPVSPGARLSAEEERELALAIRERNCKASRERMITANMRLVNMVASRYGHKGIPTDELVAEGYVGLIRAVDSFDPDQGARFSTYAVYWIGHSIVEAFVRASAAAKLSRHERADRTAVDRAASAYQVQHGRSPTTDELAAELDWPPERVTKALDLLERTRKPQSLSVTDRSDADAVTAAEESPIPQLTESQNERIQELLNVLTEQERAVVDMRFGLSGTPPANFSAIADALDVPKRVIKMRLESAMRKLGRAAAKRQSSRALAQSVTPEAA